MSSHDCEKKESRLGATRAAKDVKNWTALYGTTQTDDQELIERPECCEQCEDFTHIREGEHLTPYCSVTFHVTAPGSLCWCGLFKRDMRGVAR